MRKNALASMEAHADHCIIGHCRLPLPQLRHQQVCHILYGQYRRYHDDHISGRDVF